MRLFDLHCDTLYRAYMEKSTLFNDSFHISFNKAKNIHPYIQCLAVWIPDEYREEDAWGLFCGCVEKLREQISGRNIIWCKTADDIIKTEQEKKQGIILTVESGAVIGGRLERISELYETGVRMMTLTWNGRNELGDGIMEESDGGLTDLGREAVKEMERVGMIVDISHAGEKMFYDVYEIAEKPFAASHSNVRAVTGHRRNLTDDQFRRLVEVGGLAGLNFCADFLETKNNDVLHTSGMYDIIRHTEHMLALGGENTIAMGADFDGADIPADIKGIEIMEKLHELFVHEFGRDITDDVFFGNAYRFFTKKERRKFV